MRIISSRDLWLSVALAAGTVFVYFGALSNGFVNFDDPGYVYQNPMVQRGLCRPSITWAFGTTHQSNWHPLTWLSLEADRQWFGPEARGFHATNLALHAANTLLLFWLLRQLTGASGRSAWVAAFFAVHPLHVESVAWISERKDVLSTFFLFLTLLAWVAYVRRPTVPKYVLTAGLFAMSLMAKPMGVTLPLLMLLLDFWPLARWPRTPRHKRTPFPSQTALIVEKLPFFALSMASAAVTVFVQARGSAMQYGQSIPLGDRLLSVLVNYTTYLQQMFWPVRLAAFYPHPAANLPLWQPLLSALALAAITAIVARARTSRPVLLFGWLWFLISLLPVIGLVQVGGQSTADRYMYLPMVGLLVGVCWTLYELAGSRFSLRLGLNIVLTIGLILCGGLTSRQIMCWRDSESLWKHALAVTPPTVWTCTNYGEALKEKGREDEAESWFRQALEIDREAFAPNFNLGVILSHMGRDAEAAEHLVIALKSMPTQPLLLWNLGVVEERQGHLQQALDYYESAARYQPTSRIHQDIDRVRAKIATK